jgi:hypothetical protein
VVIAFLCMSVWVTDALAYVDFIHRPLLLPEGNALRHKVKECSKGLIQVRRVKKSSLSCW